MSGPKPTAAFAPIQRAQTLQQLQNDLQRAIDDVTPTNSKPFGQVAVFMMSWSNDTMNVRDLELQLAMLFESEFNFKVKRYIIQDCGQSSNSPRIYLLRELSTFFIQYDKPDSLCIIVYSGHASVQESGNFKKFSIYGDQHWNASMIDWDSIRQSTQTTLGRSLIILDCCYAGAAARDYDGAELLASSGWENTSPAVHNESLTFKLIQILRKNPTAVRSVADIYAELFRDFKNSNLRTTPIHVPQPQQPSIVLTKLFGPNTAGHAQDLTYEERMLATPGPNVRVLLSIELNQTVELPHVEQFKKWLTTDLPAGIAHIGVEVKDISISGVHNTPASSSVQFTIPVILWTMLDPANGAYRFLGFVWSTNQLIPSATQSTLTLRPSDFDNRLSGAHSRGHRHSQSLSGSSSFQKAGTPRGGFNFPGGGNE